MKILYAAAFMLFSFQLSAAPPTVPTSNLGFYAIDGGYFNIGWTAGNGAKRMLICKAGSPVTFVPQNGSDYSTNTNFGDGQQVAPGEYVVYNNAFTSFYLTGLSAATQYYFAMFEYNGNGAATAYLTSSFLTGSASTSSTPTIQVSNVSFSSIATNSVTVNWTNGNGQRRLVVAREGAVVNADPVNNTAYAVNAVYGSGAQAGSGNYTIYNSTGTSTTVTGLKAGTTYHFAFYEFNGSGQPQYKKPAYRASITTRTVPTTASSNVVITKSDGKELSLSWTNGNGQRRIIIAKQGSNVTALPVNNNTYAANNHFGAGYQVANGEYVVYDDNFNAANITGLNPASTYYFKIFEYDGGAGTATYLTSSFGSVNGSTAVTPTVQTAAINAANLTANSLNLAFTKGNGRARIIVARKNAAVNAAPQNFTTYNDGNYGEGSDLGNGNFVVSNTTDAFAVIHNLEANTTYHFAIFEFNGFNQPLYLAPAAVFNATTLSPLPVKLTSWSVISNDRTIKLQWTTSNEINCSRFVIERSTDGIRFYAVAAIGASGNSNREIKYSTEDFLPLNGRSFYRIKSVDKDGSFEYSDIRTVLFTATAASFIVSNLVNNSIELISPVFDTNKQQQWQIINTSGQALRNGIVSGNRINLNVSTLPAGNYWLRLSDSKNAQSISFIKQ